MIGANAGYSPCEGQRSGSLCRRHSIQRPLRTSGQWIGQEDGHVTLGCVVSDDLPSARRYLIEQHPAEEASP